MMLKGKKGQNFIEYTLLILVVSAALTAMTIYIQRAFNAVPGVSKKGFGDHSRGYHPEKEESSGQHSEG
jgi:hypothetical protein